MKKQSIFKQAFVATIMVAGMQMISSCESCSRKDKDMETTEPAGSGGASDTYGNDTIIDNGNSGNTGNSYNSGTGSGSNASGGATGNGGSSSGNSNASSSGNKESVKGSNSESATKKSTPSYDPNNDPIENSSSHARKADGTPVNPGGTSGSGMGTGSGSTGNNSRVSDPRDQKN